VSALISGLRLAGLRGFKRSELNERAAPEKRKERRHVPAVCVIINGEIRSCSVLGARGFGETGIWASRSNFCFLIFDRNQQVPARPRRTGARYDAACLFLPSCLLCLVLSFHILHRRVIVKKAHVYQSLIPTLGSWTITNGQGHLIGRAPVLPGFGVSESSFATYAQ
jgi:hypothetical protein